MSLPIQNISLLDSLSSLRQTGRSTNSRNDRGFSDRLDEAVAGGTTPVATLQKAREAAQVLSMQMLQASISIAGDSPITAPSRAQSSVNSLLQAYLAQQPARGEESSTTPQPQLQPQPQPQPVELAPPPPVSAPKQIHETRNTAWLDPIISKASLKYGVEASLIKAVIKAESNFNPQAVSHAGAQGLMQLMPATARSLGVRDSFDPEQNVMAGTRFLRDMLNRYDNNLESALAAYNWGPGNVDKSPGRLPRETRNYQTRVKEFYSSYTG